MEHGSVKALYLTFFVCLFVMSAGLVITQFQERWMRFPPGLVQGWGLRDPRKRQKWSIINQSMLVEGYMENGTITGKVGCTCTSRVDHGMVYGYILYYYINRGINFLLVPFCHVPEQ